MYEMDFLPIVIKIIVLEGRIEIFMTIVIVNALEAHDAWSSSSVFLHGTPSTVQLLLSMQ